MKIVRLDDQEWQQVIAILGETPWRIANPLIVKIHNQLQEQIQVDQVPVAEPDMFDRRRRPLAADS